MKNENLDKITQEIYNKKQFRQLNPKQQGIVKLNKIVRNRNLKPVNMYEELK